MGTMLMPPPCLVMVCECAGAGAGAGAGVVSGAAGALAAETGKASEGDDG